ncbi:hypothetical protein GCM10022204_15540 [Microlunatus aurantiacus]|uniref:Uncharacterized protein n=1 Tax=Microlunatus aurantiacus TaxID=446786 RepID=A0ABP7D2J3_9ACTN
MTLPVSRLRATLYWLLVSVTVFYALSAIGGGLGMVVADGLSMPKSLLAATPFTTFAIPGVILLLVVGGTQAWAAWLLIARHESALLWSTVAGFGMVIWIISEIYLIHAFTWIQSIYVIGGLLQLVLVLALLGVAPWLPRQLPWMPRTRNSGGAATRRAGGLDPSVQ